MLTSPEPRALVRTTRWSSPPGEAARRAVEGQVIQPDLGEVGQAVLHLGEESGGHRLVAERIESGTGRFGLRGSSAPTARRCFAPRSGRPAPRDAAAAPWHAGQLW